MTPLYDAVGTTVRRMQESVGSPAKVLFVIQTDGMENVSQEFKTAAQVRQLTQAKEAEGWTFIYLGADLTAEQSIAAAMQMGLRAANVQPYGKAHTGDTFHTLAQSSQSYAQNAVAGTASTEFFKEHGDEGKRTTTKSS